MKPAALAPLFALLLPACLTPAQPAQPVAPPEPAPGTAAEGQEGHHNGIPWAPGEGPGPARDVGEQPPSSDAPMSEDAVASTQQDGIVQGGPPGCTGKAPVALRAEIQARIAALKDCSTSAPSDFRGEGELRYTVRVEKDGSVSTIYQLSDTLHVPGVTACVEAKLKQPFEEKPVYGCAQFVIPYQLLIEEEPGQ